MKQLFSWFMVTLFAAWTMYAAYNLARGWANAVQREGPWAAQPKVAWPNRISEQMLCVVLGVLSTIRLAAYASSDRWEQRLRRACECDVTKCHCTIDAELLYSRPGGSTEN